MGVCRGSTWGSGAGVNFTQDVDTDNNSVPQKLNSVPGNRFSVHWGTNKSLTLEAITSNLIKPRLNYIPFKKKKENRKKEKKRES